MSAFEKIEKGIQIPPHPAGWNELFSNIFELSIEKGIQIPPHPAGWNELFSNRQQV